MGFPSRPHEFEAPDVVTDVRPRDETDFDEIAEVSVDGDSIVAGRRELLRDLAVAEWGPGCLEALQHGDAW